MENLTLDNQLSQTLVGIYGDLEGARKAVIEDIIISERQKGNMSLGESAEALGMSYADFCSLLLERGYPLDNASHEDTEKNYQLFSQRFDQTS